MNAAKDAAAITSDGMSSWPRFKELDTLLRCSICFEYMKTAMLLSGCSHNYCSLCIRRYICYKEQCPTCLKHVVESDLRNNRVLDHIIELFSNRSLHLQISAASDNLTTAGAADNEGKDEDNITKLKVKKSADKCQQSPFNFMSKSASNVVNGRCHGTNNDKGSDDVISRPKRRSSVTYTKSAIVVSDSEDEFDDDSDRTADNSPWRRSDHSDNPIDLPKSNVIIPAAVAGNCWELEIPPSHISCSSPRPNTDLPSFRSPLTSVNCHRISSPSSPNITTVVSDVVRPQTGSEQVSCPVCSVSVPTRNINLHLDRCLAMEKNPSASICSVAPKRKCLPKLVYNLLSDKELRKKVAEVGLPVQGDRKMMIQRHREYTLIYNSECDSLNPKSGADIVRDVLNAEGNKIQLSASSSLASLPSLLRIEKKASSEDVDIARKKYAEQHKSQFAQLLEAARKSRAAKSSQSATLPPKPFNDNDQSSSATTETSAVASLNDSVESKHFTAATTSNSVCSFFSMDSSSPTETGCVLPTTNLPTLQGLSGYVSDSETSNPDDEALVDDNGGAGLIVSDDLVSTSSLSVDQRSVGGAEVIATAISSNQQNRCDESSTSLPPTQDYSYRMMSMVDDETDDEDERPTPSSPDLLGFLDGSDTELIAAAASCSDETMTTAAPSRHRTVVMVPEELPEAPKSSRRVRRQQQSIEVAATELMNVETCCDITEPATDKKRRLRSETKRQQTSTISRSPIKRRRKDEGTACKSGSGDSTGPSHIAGTSKRCRRC